jgi:hypothetical protein
MARNPTWTRFHKLIKPIATVRSVSAWSLNCRRASA